MSMALIAQIEANTDNGGSAQGFLTGTDSSSAANTFYGRRLTDMLINESFSGTPTVNTFTASTGGSGSASVEGTFVLVPGSYRITIYARYNPNVAGSIVAGLYNVTSAAFEVYAGGSEPILFTTSTTGSLDVGLQVLDAKIVVATSNKTYAIRHQASNTTIARDKTMCGQPTGISTANVNGAAARNLYCSVKITRTA